FLRNLNAGSPDNHSISPYPGRVTMTTIRTIHASHAPDGSLDITAVSGNDGVGDRVVVELHESYGAANLRLPAEYQRSPLGLDLWTVKVSAEQLAGLGPYTISSDYYSSNGVNGYL